MGVHYHEMSTRKEQSGQGQGILRLIFHVFLSSSLTVLLPFSSFLAGAFQTSMTGGFQSSTVHSSLTFLCSYSRIESFKTVEAISRLTLHQMEGIFVPFLNKTLYIRKINPNHHTHTSSHFSLPSKILAPFSCWQASFSCLTCLQTLNTNIS